MKYNSKTLFDSGTIRMQVSDFSILVEELPRKPCKTTLRSFEVNTSYAVSTLHRDDFIPANIIDCPCVVGGKSVRALMEMLVEGQDTYAVIRELVQSAILLLAEKPENADVARLHGVSIYEREQHYTKVVPEGVEAMNVACADFMLSVGWTTFSAYSPNSDFQLSDPHYTQVHQSSPAAARKLYKLAQAKKAELAGLSWSSFTEWLKSQKVGFDYSFSQWS